MSTALPLSAAALRLIDDLSSEDIGYASAFSIFTSPRYRLSHRVWQYVRLEAPSRGIDFEAMLDNPTWSTGEALLLAAAWSLFNGGTELDLQLLVCKLDDRALRLVLRAMAIRGRLDDSSDLFATWADRA